MRTNTETKAKTILERHNYAIKVPTFQVIGFKRNAQRACKVVKDRPTMPGMIFIDDRTIDPIRLSRSPIVLSKLYLNETAPLCLTSDEIDMLQEVSQREKVQFRIGERVRHKSMVDAEHREPMTIEVIKRDKVKLLASWSPFPIWAAIKDLEAA